MFPLEIDIDNPKFLVLLNKLIAITDTAAAQQARGGLGAKISKVTTSAKAGFVFLQLFTMRTKRNEVPVNIRLAPSY